MVSMNAALCDVVYTNLVYQQLWTETEIINFEDVPIVCGKPSHRLTNDDNDNDADASNSEDIPSDGKEYVYPILMHQYKNSGFSMKSLDHIFSRLPDMIKRLTLGIVNDDGTVVYYFIYKGLRKPKKN
ncbi:Sen15p [Kluyveromyces lactis]|uniref:KLLA0F26334p n=1 Tax=Kluyveromyces lactis (strain ATCC 8585 / CBS 2359 / DSM 70799 / NBRC 1267 / NRRL Y-1140 / WM37) TaxID=284590 RepID=Q6CII6_KLULA|nr:uncharacterized protein KLLA0_F26334g [Kluyveromyces lactis]CAG98961.1 KLLA0F26334p [Kluyveromyces lactis]|eukprot:XP_456253.1 uncharacterized protein KLLA0_F26334g [Kluyveromyces lactis]